MAFVNKTLAAVLAVLLLGQTVPLAAQTYSPQDMPAQTDTLSADDLAQMQEEIKQYKISSVLGGFGAAFGGAAGLFLIYKYFNTRSALQHAQTAQAEFTQQLASLKQLNEWNSAKYAEAFTQKEEMKERLRLAYDDIHALQHQLGVTTEQLAKTTDQLTLSTEDLVQVIQERDYMAKTNRTYRTSNRLLRQEVNKDRIQMATLQQQVKDQKALSAFLIKSDREMDPIAAAYLDAIRSSSAAKSQRLAKVYWEPLSKFSKADEQAIKAAMSDIVLGLHSTEEMLSSRELIKLYSRIFKEQATHATPKAMRFLQAVGRQLLRENKLLAVLLVTGGLAGAQQLLAATQPSTQAQRLQANVGLVFNASPEELQEIARHPDQKEAFVAWVEVLRQLNTLSEQDQVALARLAEETLSLPSAADIEPAR